MLNSTPVDGDFHINKWANKPHSSGFCQTMNHIKCVRRTLILFSYRLFIRNNEFVEIFIYIPMAVFGPLICAAKSTMRWNANAMRALQKSKSLRKFRRKKHIHNTTRQTHQALWKNKQNCYPFTFEKIAHNFLNLRSIYIQFRCGVFFFE